MLAVIDTFSYIFILTFPRSFWKFFNFKSINYVIPVTVSFPRRREPISNFTSVAYSKWVPACAGMTLQIVHFNQNGYIFLKISEPLVPPNPNELESAALMTIFSAL